MYYTYLPEIIIVKYFIHGSKIKEPSVTILRFDHLWKKWLINLTLWRHWYVRMGCHTHQECEEGTNKHWQQQGIYVFFFYDGSWRITSIIMFTSEEKKKEIEWWSCKRSFTFITLIETSLFPTIYQTSVLLYIYRVLHTF